MVTILEEKINLFETSSPGFDTGILPGFYRLGTVQLNGVEVEKLEHKEFKIINRSPLTKPTRERPVYFKQGNILNVFPDTVTSTEVNVFYIRRPVQVGWGYVVTLEKALYNANRSTDFELHGSEETDLVMKILALAGITMDDQALYQIAGAEDNKNTQQEKQ
jgi:hypothetical protein